MKVHSTFGGEFKETTHQRSLAIEMKRTGLSFGREVERPIP